ncbi:MAG: 16S rRNA (guanine(527)-N(7))-methyltransferase RsmG [Propylenella sp.]
MSSASPNAPAAALRDDDASSAAALDRFGFLTGEARTDLRRFVALLKEWQRAHNLVARGTLDEVWTRHIADSLQLLDHAPDYRHWVDLGSGAGFPGLVVAIASKGHAERRFTLIEANGKKAAFLRAAIRETGANASVVAERIEAHPKIPPADVVSARALAPLSELFRLGAPYLGEGAVMLLLKGQDFVHELNAASKSWDFDVLDFPSVTDPGGRVLAIRNLRPRGPRP